ncbi:triple tyrosine motif-containing protein [Fictibacillus phosphorivorans]|nr:triple tyrosine motif-containing protein [Fictibacillus phosphorivorans]
MKIRPLLLSAGVCIFLGLSMQVLEVSADPEVYGGARHSYLVEQNGNVYGWGENGYHQLGYKDSYASIRYPEQIGFIDHTLAQNVKMFSSSKSNYFTLAMMEDGTLRFWGQVFTYDGNLGGYWNDWNYSKYNTVQNLDGTPFTGATMISSGDSHMTALKDDGTVWTWGYNSYGQLGNGKTENTPYPQQVIMEDGTPLKDVVSISSGAWHTLALKKDGSVYGWGWNRGSQLSVTPQMYNTKALPILTEDKKVLSGIIGIQGGGDHSLALTNKNEVMTWGNNTYGQLGNGSTSSTPQMYPGFVLDSNNERLTQIKALNASGYSSYALTFDSKILSWGRNQFGQLGQGNVTTNEKVPAYVKSINNEILDDVYAFSPGFQHVVAIQKDGKLWRWGDFSGNSLAIQVLKNENEPYTTTINGNIEREEVVNPMISIKNNQVHLKWNYPNNEIKFVDIYKNGDWIGTSPSTIYIDDYTADAVYTLKAVDGLGNNTDGVQVELKNIQPVKIISVITDKLAPQPAGSSISIHAAAEGGTERLYKFWILENGQWKVLQDYSTASSVKWNPATEGNYKISVHVKDSNSSKTYDDYKAFEYKIESASVLLNDFSSQLSAPRSVYSSIPLAASATGGSEKLYKFFAYHNGVWTTLQDYSPTSTIRWIPKFTGDYKLVVHAKDQNSMKSYDSYKQMMFKVIDAPVMQSLTTSLASPQLVGKTIQIKSSATGGTEKLYKYWVHDGVKWHVLKDFSTSTTFDWKPISKGNYKISVHVKDRYSTRSYDSYKALNYTIK